MAELEAQIRQAYEKSGNVMGWRFLNSPARTLEAAEVAFIGLNPGGAKIDQAHGEFAMEEGQSAYRDERWKNLQAGESPLQKQVLALFHRLNVNPEDVLSGNIVPFRSPDWNSLVEPKASVEFGKKLWREIFERAKPKVIVSMGAVATKIVNRLLQAEDISKQPVGWGNITASRAQFDGGFHVGLPHLSRFGIMTRDQSAPYLDKLFSDQ